MKKFISTIKAVDPYSGEIKTYAGPAIWAPTVEAAQEYCNENGLGYLHLNGDHGSVSTAGEKAMRFSAYTNLPVAAVVIKQRTAELIDLIKDMAPLDPRAAATACTQLEGAAHWAVYAATAPPPEVLA